MKHEDEDDGEGAQSIERPAVPITVHGHDGVGRSRM